MIESQAYDYLPDMASSKDKLNRLFELETDFIFESSEQAWAALLLGFGDLKMRSHF